MTDDGTPRLSQLAHLPVTAGVVLLSVGTTVAWLAGMDIGALTVDVRAFQREPWRLLTSALPHVGVFHLAFNVFWVWRFGALLERRFGHLAVLAIMIVLAATSAAAEYAAFDGGVGLSGVGYGLLGVLMVLGPRDPRLSPIEPGVILLFAGWFLVCIGTTIAGWMPVANVAHALGWVAGAAIGAAIGMRGAARAAACAGILLLSAAAFLGATRFRPALNRSPQAGQTDAWLGYRALVDGDPQAAIVHFERALALNDRASWWYDYGLALDQSGRHDEALVALRRAVELDPTDRRHREGLAAIEQGPVGSSPAPR